MKSWGRHGENRLVRDPLADELRYRGYAVQREYLVPGGFRCDIHAKRYDETRLIECKLRDSFKGVTQVLGYMHRIGAPVDVIPTLAVPEWEATDVLRGVCRLAGVELWVEGQAWNLSFEARDARGETEVRRRFERLAQLVREDPRGVERLEEKLRDKWDEIVTHFRSVCGLDPIPQLGRRSDGALAVEFPQNWGYFMPPKIRRDEPFPRCAQG